MTMKVRRRSQIRIIYSPLNSAEKGFELGEPMPGECSMFN